MRHAASAQVEAVAAYVAARAGVAVEGRRHPELLERVSGAMARAGATSAARFCEMLDHDGAAFEELVVALTVGESYFLREAQQMELLRTEVLIERSAARGPHRGLRLWSAGCAAGQEAYTLAMVLEEEGMSEGAHIMATDLSLKALEEAGKGVYGKWSLRAVDEQRRRKWFRPVPGGFRVEPGLARFVTFAHDNLLDVAGDPRLDDMDVVLCRNVLVYLTPDAVRRATSRLVASLAPGGWLLTASTDPHLDPIGGLKRVSTPAGVAYRRLAGEPGAGEPAGAAGRGRGGTKGAGHQAARPPRAGRHEPRATSARTRPTPAPRPPRPGPAPAPARAAPPAGDVPAAERLAAARQALVEGDYQRAAQRAGELVEAGDDVTGEGRVVLLRALGSAGDLAGARQAAAEAVGRFPLHVELRLLQAIVLMESGHADEAAAAAKAALYIEPGLAMAHLTLARAEGARNDDEAARRSYRNALALLDALPVDHPVALADGETAGRLAALARAGHGSAPQRTARAAGP